MLAAVITSNDSVAEPVWGSGVVVRPVVGTFTTEAEAEDGLGTPLNVMIAAAGTDDASAPRPPAIGAAPVRDSVPYPGAGPDTARFPLAYVNHKYRVEHDGFTASALAKGPGPVA